MDIYGLIGKNLRHSFSPVFFEEKFRKSGINAEYRLFEIEDPDEIPRIIEDNPDLRGLNVTIPYKRSVSRYMHKVDKSVQITGSLNTIKISRKRGNTKITGFNTDIIGFEETIKPYLCDDPKLRALVLGTGATANSVAYVLRKLGILFSFVSRKPSKTLHIKYSWIDGVDVSSSKLIINTTPLGMYPNIDTAPELPYNMITHDHILYDVVYNPAETLFLKKGREQGATCINGQKMLEIQAEASWKIWNK